MGRVRIFWLTHYLLVNSRQLICILFIQNNKDITVFLWLISATWRHHAQNHSGGRQLFLRRGQFTQRENNKDITVFCGYIRLDSDASSAAKRPLSGGLGCLPHRRAAVHSTTGDLVIKTFTYRKMSLICTSSSRITRDITVFFCSLISIVAWSSSPDTLVRLEALPHRRAAVHTRKMRSCELTLPLHPQESVS
ncbi:hypothetical protein AVEN_134699-1 [Araneus ventricosus]|uniref:Secreted protein n=1 Tax=Araneus ventricosus TaxID=182803 RepID=A0A4Y2HVJ9_ARAVE|nr:hypothetical protein AVEN_134699-1 [Araneus ventricosus]